MIYEHTSDFWAREQQEPSSLWTEVTWSPNPSLRHAFLHCTSYLLQESDVTPPSSTDRSSSSRSSAHKQKAEQNDHYQVIELWCFSIFHGNCDELNGDKIYDLTGFGRQAWSLWNEKVIKASSSSSSSSSHSWYVTLLSPHLRYYYAHYIKLRVRASSSSSSGEPACCWELLHVRRGLSREKLTLE